MLWHSTVAKWRKTVTARRLCPWWSLELGKRSYSTFLCFEWVSRCGCCWRFVTLTNQSSRLLVLADLTVWEDGRAWLLLTHVECDCACWLVHFAFADLSWAHCLAVNCDWLNGCWHNGCLQLFRFVGVLSLVAGRSAPYKLECSTEWMWLQVMQINNVDEAQSC